MNEIILWFLAAFLLAGAAAYAGYRANALSASGAVAACMVGGTIFSFGGFGGAAILIAFFVSSSALSSFKSSDVHKKRASQTFEKGGRRDAAQVLANGGIAALFAAISPLAGIGYLPLFFGGFVGALAAATADTWATEIGVLSTGQPRMITTGQPVDAGTSGAVTFMGSSAALLGALFLGLFGALVVALGLTGQHWQGSQAPIIAAALAGGAGGALLDSLLGATLQATYWCPTCQTLTESRIHKCGTKSVLKKGLAAVNNDIVNLAATAAGGLLGALTAAFMLP